MKIWILNDYNKKKYSFWQKFIENFSKENGIDVHLEIKSKDGLWKSFFDFFENPENKIADIVEIPHYWTSFVAKLGLAFDVSLFVDDDILKKIYPFLTPTMLCCDITKGVSKFFSIPVAFEIMVMFFNKRMISKFASPSEMKNIKWNDIPLLCEKLKKRYKKKDYYPFDNTNLEGYISSHEMLACVMNRASGFFSKDFLTINLHKEEVQISINEFFELAIKKYYPLFEEHFFESGFLKRWLSSLAFGTRRDISDEDIDVCRFPDIARSGELAKSYNLFFFSGSNNLDEIKKFIKDFYTERNLIMLSDEIGSFCPFKGSGEYYLAKREIDFYFELFDSLVFIPNIVIYPTFERMLDGFFMKQCIEIVNGRFDYKEFSKKLLEIKAIGEYLMSSYWL